MILTAIALFVDPILQGLAMDFIQQYNGRIAQVLKDKGFQKRFHVRYVVFSVFAMAPTIQILYGIIYYSYWRIWPSIIGLMLFWVLLYLDRCKDLSGWLSAEMKIFDDDEVIYLRQFRPPF
jgi:hypothetical protein